MKKNKRHWRLICVGGAFVLVTLLLWGRLIQVQVFERDRYEEIAGDQGKVTREIPPVRGGIFDRSGRPLALSIRSCSVALRPQEIKDSDAVVSALSKYLSVSKRSIRKRLRSEKTFVWVKRQCSLSDDAYDRLMSLRGVEVLREADRVYPYGSIASKVVGFVGHDAKGMAGIEAGFNEQLTGTPGWEQVQQDGVYRSRGYHTYARKKPVNGKHVFLTIDARLQEIAELELRRAAKNTKARGGVVLIMQCETGEILALAEYPSAASRSRGSRADSLWTIRSISCVYEPGSTFKLVTSAALLETSKVQSFDMFDGEKGRAKLGSAVISDAHPYEDMTFKEAFVHSSNIVMAKAASRLEPQKFLEFVRLFGFGAKTGVDLLGESPGSVAPLENWSQRTQITMAFGQEIAVTPLQLANAFATVANGGELMVPRIVGAVVDESTETTERFEPVRVRRVISKKTASRLREYCRSVVEEGTGAKASLGFLDVAGKTGTAQKASPNGGYLSRQFVSSFVGFAPSDDPKIVCLVLLDEPDFNNRFGGVSCAPVFAKVAEAIANSSHIFDDVLATVLINAPPESSPTFKAPNFLRLSREAAMERARLYDLNLLCRGDGGEVVSQEPDPGVAMERDEVVRVYLSGSGTMTSGVPVEDAPDLRGLPLRLAKRRAARAGFRCTVVGSGIVTRQVPKAGGRSKSGVIKIYCKTDVKEKRSQTG
ncbi:MAG: PASTA domain-containing protein [Candidatus Latescibacterota bacterium]|nr:MAG: PASTA domain-containing protein [Candidatus Latescibacterota bacterium]